MNILPAALVCLTLAACQTATPLRVLAYNIHHGAGMDGALDLERIGALIRDLDPDIVALQEVDFETRRTDGVDQARRLGELTGMHHVFGKFMDYQGGEYGMALLSKLEIVASDNYPLPRGAEPRTALAIRARVAGGGPDVVVVGIHLYRTRAERLAQANKLIETLDQTAKKDAIVILAGDFNSRPADPVMQRLALQFHIVPKRGPSDTFPANAPDREIDYFLIRPRARVEMASSRVVPETVASDHRPIVLDVRLR